MIARVHRSCQRGLLLSATTPLLALLLSTVHGNRPPIPPALQNLGNTCYLNAQIQCAYQIPQVRRIVLSKDRDGCSTAHAALRELFQDMMMTQSSSSSSSTSPRQFCQALGIPIWQQQDSQEFWKLLLPALQLPQLTDLYQGAYQDYIVALHGSPRRERRKEEAFLDISLDVQPTLEDALALFVQTEVLKATEGNGWRPEKGAPAVDAEKGIQLQAPTLPPILQLHLKRFQFDWNTEMTTKINAPCIFPVVLDLAQFCGASQHPEEQNVLYDLQGIVVHAGEYGQGHYYAYVRPDVQSDVWYRCNDNVIEQVDLKHVLCDSFGGQQRPSELHPDYHSLSKDEDDSKASTMDTRPETKTDTLRFWTRWARRCFGPRGSLDGDSSLSYGYGGPTSSAYVLQYVRRTAVPTLYASMDDPQKS